MTQENPVSPNKSQSFSVAMFVCNLHLYLF